MRRVDHALPWGRELEAGEDPINDRRLEIMRDALKARVERAAPTFRVQTPESLGLPHLQYNAKKRLMEQEREVEIRRERQKMAENSLLYRMRAERADKPQGMLHRPAKTSFQLNKERFQSRVKRENREMNRRLQRVGTMLPVQQWAKDARRNEQILLNCSRFGRRVKRQKRKRSRRRPHAHGAPDYSSNGGSRASILPPI